MRLYTFCYYYFYNFMSGESGLLFVCFVALGSLGRDLFNTLDLVNKGLEFFYLVF